MDNEQLFGEDTELRRHEATSRVWRQVVPFHVTTVAEAHVDARSQHQVEESNAVFPIEDFDYDENNDFSVDSDSNSRRPAKGGFVALLLSMSPVRDGGIDGDDDDIADTVLETVAVMSVLVVTVVVVTVVVVLVLVVTVTVAMVSVLVVTVVTMSVLMMEIVVPTTLPLATSRTGAAREESAVNASMSSVRIAVGWGFGQIISEWAMLDFKKKMSIGNVPVGMLYQVATILTNCVTIARHQNVISSYFDVPPPNFQEYFACTAD
ncbi:hypothetical protein F443_14387 [Phytophthora nicotianae P1569]|uniref:Uncharacterized protein n=1 Tax=Phytophthora nicotianae P1569 TaxID=1317065 RepID=V9EPR3_PHYNI|nr:hypothetical protein F443_14387 [Phytophthora nicotianae P1569]